MFKTENNDVNIAEDENTIVLKQLSFIPPSLFEFVTIVDRKIARRISRFYDRRNKSILRKLREKCIINKSKKVKVKKHLNEYKKIISKTQIDNKGILCFDGNGDETTPNIEADLLEPPPEDPDGFDTVSDQGSVTENKSLDDDSIDNRSEAPQMEKEKSPISFQSVETPSYHNENPFCGLDRKLALLLSKKPKGCVLDLKDNMKARLYAKIFDENYLLTQIEEYQDFKKRKDKAVERQAKTINSKTPKRTKKSTPIRKYFYINKKKIPAWKDEIDTSGTSVTELITEADEEKEELMESEQEPASAQEYIEEIDDAHPCEDSEKSISCPSETDSEGACKCLACTCACNEYMRFRTYLLKKYERDNKADLGEEIAKEKKVHKMIEENKDRWDDLCNLDEVSQWSEDTELEASTTSGSSCGIVRKCHCSHCGCGCDDYREYLLYKLNQVASRRRRRNRRREEKAQTLQRIIEENYQEDEYVRRVREFINKYYVKAGGSKPPNICSCGLYNCRCTPALDEEMECEVQKKDTPSSRKLVIDLSSNGETVSKHLSYFSGDRQGISEEFSSMDDERRKVRFGSDSLKTSAVSFRSQKTISSSGMSSTISFPSSIIKNNRSSDSTSMGKEIAVKNLEETGAILAKALENNDSILNFNIDEYFAREEVVKPSVDESDASSYGSFDYKKYLVEKECDCEDFSKYMAYKRKTRRLAEKQDPVLKHFRKRHLYLSNLARAEQWLDHTSSETESPVRVPSVKICEKYEKYQTGNAERKLKIFKKKKRKLEKKVILEIIKKGSHLYPCKCSFSSNRKDYYEIDESVPFCERCQVHLKINDCKYGLLKTKIDPSIPLGDIEEDDCILGYTRTFPECPVCLSNTTRIQFDDKVEHKIISDERESYVLAMNRDAEADLKDFPLNEEGKGEVSPTDEKPASQGKGGPKSQAGTKSKEASSKKRKGKKNKKGKKVRTIKKSSKKKGGKLKKKKSKGKKKLGKNKKNLPKKKTEAVYYTQYISVSSSSSERISPEEEDDELDANVSLFDSQTVFKLGDFEYWNE